MILSLSPEPAAFLVKTTLRTRNPKVTNLPFPPMSLTLQVISLMLYLCSLHSITPHNGFIFLPHAAFSHSLWIGLLMVVNSIHNACWNGERCCVYLPPRKPSFTHVVWSGITFWVLSLVYNSIFELECETFGIILWWKAQCVSMASVCIIPVILQVPLRSCVL